MNTKRCAISGAIAAVLGTANMGMPTSVLAGIIPDGTYQIQIQTTPTRIDPYGPGGTNFKITPPTGLESSFTFGKLPNVGSQGMTDNGVLISTSNRGSSIAGDGFAGVLDITVVGDAITVQSFSVDTIAGTAGGNFAQHLDTELNPIMPFDPLPAPTTANMSGSIDASGNMTLVLTGRMGTIDGPITLTADRRWNVDAREPAVVVVNSTLTVAAASAPWNALTTGTTRTASALAGTENTITGVSFVAAGDINGDGFTDFTGTLVSGGDVAADWATFKGAAYFEVWKVNIVSVSVAVNLPPTASPSAVQNGLAVVGTISSSAGDGTVVVSANATDPESGTLSNAWTVTSSGGCAVVVGGTTGATVEIDPSACAADDSVTASVLVTDDGVPPKSTNGSMTFTVAAAAVTDSDQDGIPDSADRSPNDASVIQLSANAGDGEASAGAGAAFALGSTASCSGSSGILVTASDIATVGGAGCLPPAADPVDTVANVGGYFDFNVRVVSSGDSAVVVLPLTAAIPDNATYRKFQESTGWSDFLSVGNDTFASAPGALGNCPGPGDAAYVADALVSGYFCVQLTITDGGPNDADGSANGLVVDPGGVGAVAVASAPTGTNPKQRSFENNGCTISAIQSSSRNRFDWVVLAGFIAWVGSISWRKRKRAAK